MISHTPGPWRVPLDEPYSAERPTYILEDADGHQLMLLARLSEVGPEQHAANARLIAAAPGLLAALKLHVDETGHTSGCCANNICECSTTCQQTRAAIAKARSEP